MDWASRSNLLVTAGDNDIPFVQTVGNLNPALHACSCLNRDHLGFSVNNGENQLGVWLWNQCLFRDEESVCAVRNLQLHFDKLSWQECSTGIIEATTNNQTATDGVNLWVDRINTTAEGFVWISIRSQIDLLTDFDRGNTFFRNRELNLQLLDCFEVDESLSRLNVITKLT